MSSSITMKRTQQGYINPNIQTASTYAKGRPGGGWDDSTNKENARPTAPALPKMLTRPRIISADNTLPSKTQEKPKINNASVILDAPKPLATSNNNQKAPVVGSRIPKPPKMSEQVVQQPQTAPRKSSIESMLSANSDETAATNGSKASADQFNSIIDSLCDLDFANEPKKETQANPNNIYDLYKTATSAISLSGDPMAYSMEHVAACTQYYPTYPYYQGQACYNPYYAQSMYMQQGAYYVDPAAHQNNYQQANPNVYPQQPNSAQNLEQAQNEVEEVPEEDPEEVERKRKQREENEKKFESLKLFM